MKFTYFGRILILILLFGVTAFGQEKSLVNTSRSPYAKLKSIDISDVRWTTGFWAERFQVCKESMVPHMMGNYMNPEVSHAFRNFEIAAGLEKGEHSGPAFHDGDFYKILEGMIMVWSVSRDAETEKNIDAIIETIAKTQRADGYIHTPVVIKQLQNSNEKKEFGERLDFETYNMGHLMTASCLHYRLTGKKSLLNTAIKATDFLYDFYKRSSSELARNAICPSHYMGVIEMYRTTRDPRYLELAKNLIAIRSLVENGTDDNQDRLPFLKQDKAIGHAVRANYLYAGVADIYAETGDDSLMMTLDKIWHNMTEHKMYITGACGALYDGVSPDGTSYKPDYNQKVHQAYGRDFQLPSLTAHNESCANIGNILWNWRMFLATGEARFADIMELTMYNSLLAGVSLDGKGYFYTNPLCVAHDIPFTLRWSREREGYISFCNCCPPNTIRTIAEISNYVYTTSDKGLWINLYGSNHLKTKLADGSSVSLNLQTDYPWDGKILIELEECPNHEFSVFLRIPGWAPGAEILINGKKQLTPVKPRTYAELSGKWKKGDQIALNLPMEAQLVEANPLVEEVHNQIAVKRGPVVYCIESADIPENRKIFDYIIPATSQFKPKTITIAGSKLSALESKVELIPNEPWTGQLYRPVNMKKETVTLQLVPYYAWGNRGKGDMSVWLPVSK
ncbi:MAG TPA: glycoside hydrolase family 127 protein [Prolixibacteraceae bacterium]|nr:glycoside hydrolase family 127 protein [Prolixibacteraceae bacterium]